MSTYSRSTMCYDVCTRYVLCTIMQTRLLCTRYIIVRRCTYVITRVYTQYKYISQYLVYSTLYIVHTLCTIYDVHAHRTQYIVRVHIHSLVLCACTQQQYIPVFTSRLYIYMYIPVGSLSVESDQQCTSNIVLCTSYKVHRTLCTQQGYIQSRATLYIIVHTCILYVD